MHDVETGPIDHYLRAMADQRASDLLLVAGAAATFRIDGELRPAGSDGPLTAEDTTRVIKAGATGPACGATPSTSAAAPASRSG
jgi:Tfp pilus assembly ATPase PilU